MLNIGELPLFVGWKFYFDKHFAFAEIGILGVLNLEQNFIRNYGDRSLQEN